MEEIDKLVAEFVADNSSELAKLDLEESGLYTFDGEAYNGVLRDLVTYHALLNATRWNAAMPITKLEVHTVTNLDNLIDRYQAFKVNKDRADEAYTLFMQEVKKCNIF